MQTRPKFAVAEYIFLGWSKERQANELTKAEAQFDSQVK